MEPNRDLASWLIRQRLSIEARLAEQLGPAAPRSSGPEAEALRRFRSFVSTALVRDVPSPPALDGLRPNERRVMALLTAWCETAAEHAGPSAEPVRAALRPLLERFRLAIRGSDAGRRSKGRPRATRRAVSAAIDRVADAFLAIDVADGRIVDANPAAGALLGLERDALLGLELPRFVPPPACDAWWAELDALSEGREQARFRLPLQDVSGDAIHLDASATRLGNRSRTLALVLLRDGAAPEREARTRTPDAVDGSAARAHATPSVGAPPTDALGWSAKPSD